MLGIGSHREHPAGCAQQRWADVWGMEVAEYGISIVALFDVLGFSAVVDSTAPQFDEPLKILQAFREESEPSPELAKLYEKSFYNFSDTSVRLTNVLSEANMDLRSGILFHELIDLLHIQLRLLYANETFIRGGVTVDYAYSDAQFIFGPGVVEAYRLEQAALYPRVVVDKRVLEVLGDLPVLHASHHTPDDEEAYVRSLLCQFGDEEWFVDYLRGGESEADDLAQYGEFLKRHRDLVDAALAVHTGDAHVLEKYEWLKLYHNDVVSGFDPELTLTETGYSLDQLCIP
jgi:hypothetical protein